MRVAVMVSADRADDDRERALLAGDGRALSPRGSELAVADAIGGRDHAVVDEHDFAFDRAVRRCAQRVDAVEGDDLTGDAFLSGRTAIAKRGDDHRLGEGGYDLRAFVTA